MHGHGDVFPSPNPLPGEERASPDVIVVALSARALAAAARRAGLRPAAVDLFCDEDTQALAHPCIRLPAEGLRLDGGVLADALDRPEFAGLPLVWAAGFEDQPELLERLAAGRPVAGTPPARVARAKDPFALAALLERLGIPHPAVTRAAADDGRWLVKRRGAAGGAHVTPAAPGAAPAAGCYLQRRIDGHPLSALLLADGARALVLGFSRQWADPAPGAPFRFGGAAGPLRLPPVLAGRLADMAVRATEALELVGLASADFLVSAQGIHLLEVNPRPGASLELFDRDPMPPLFRLHLDACAGRLPAAPLPLPGPCRAALIGYARHPLALEPGPPWPAWTADRPARPTRIPPGAPVCTVLADGAATRAARRRAEARRDTAMEAIP